MLAALFLQVSSGCARHEADSDSVESDAPVVPVRVAAAESRSFRDVVVANGQWKSSNTLILAAPFGAYVESVHVEVGDAVTRGQALAVLETHESRAAVLGAEQLLAAAGDASSRAEAERAIRQARHDVVRLPLRAPAAGTISKRSASPGAEVAEGAELFQMVEERGLVFEAHVPAAAVSSVHAGQAASIRLEDGTREAARVARRLPQTDAGDQTVLVWFSPAAPVTASLIDRFGAATIEMGAPRATIAVPDSAVVEDDLTGETRVAVVGADSIATWQTVTLGLGENGWHEVRSGGLAAGARVIVSGQRGLPDKTRVRPLP